MTDFFFREGTATWTAGAESALTVTPSASPLVPPNGDTNKATRGLIIGGAGNLVLQMADGTQCTVVIPATACGQFLPLAVRYVLAATTATSIVAFY